MLLLRHDLTKSYGLAYHPGLTMEYFPGVERSITVDPLRETSSVHSNSPPAPAAILPPSTTRSSCDQSDSNSCIQSGDSCGDNSTYTIPMTFTGMRIQLLDNNKMVWSWLYITCTIWYYFSPPFSVSYWLIHLLFSFTFTHKVLCSALILALVSAIAPLNSFISWSIKAWFGTLTPTVSLPGLRQGFKVSRLFSTRVTGPGRRVDKRLISTVFTAHLRVYELQFNHVHT